MFQQTRWWKYITTEIVMKYGMLTTVRLFIKEQYSIRPHLKHFGLISLPLDVLHIKSLENAR